MKTINKKRHDKTRSDGLPFRTKAPLIKQDPIPVPSSVTPQSYDNEVVETIEPSGTIKRKGNVNGKQTTMGA